MNIAMVLVVNLVNGALVGLAVSQGIHPALALGLISWFVVCVTAASLR